MKRPTNPTPATSHRTLTEQAGSCLVLWLCLLVAVGILACAYGGLYMFWR